MALPTTYSTGTASINANEVAVTGQGTTWLTSGLQAGDLFWASGISVRILSINSNTSLTLAFPWPVAARTAASYEVRFTPDATRVLASARAVLDAIAGGNVKALGDLVSAADKLPYFTGAGTAALADFKAIARQFIAANFFPVEQGGGAGQGNNKVKVGWDGAKLKAMVDALDLGGVWTDSLSAINFTTPGRAKLPNGLIIQWGYATVNGDATITFPSTFPTICTAVVATPQSTIAGTETLSVCVRDVAPGTFVGEVRRTSGGVVSGATSIVLFIAIGF
jgi:hypothetical protein